MAEHIMSFEQIPGALGTDEGYLLCMVKQAIAASVANDDTLKFKNVKDVIPVGIKSEIGSVIDFDASAASSADWVLTVNTTVLTTGTAATWIKGLALIKF